MYHPGVAENVEIVSGSAEVPLYMLNDYLKEFAARIVRFEKRGNRVGIVLDRTAFYPGGGHQVHDTGEIQGSSFRVLVDEVKKVGNEIVHYGVLEEGDVEEIMIGEEVVGRINWERRYHIMKLHTAEHIFMHLMEKETGVALENGQFGPQEGMIVLSDRVDIDRILDIEKEVNKIIRKNLAVKRVIRDNISEIVIEGLGKKRCGGTHVRRTGEIGFFKILRIHGERTIWYNVGDPSIDSLMKDFNELIKTSKILGISQVETEKIVNKISSIVSEASKLRENTRIFSQIIADLILKNPVRGEKEIDNNIWRIIFVDIGKSVEGRIKELEGILKHLGEKLENDQIAVIKVSDNTVLLVSKRKKRIVRRVRDLINNIINKMKKYNMIEGEIVISGVSGSTMLIFKTPKDLSKFLNELLPS